MSKPIVLQEDFSGGAYQDVPRHKLPKGKVWQLQDMIPDFASGDLTKRGAWARSYSAMSATSSSYGAGVGYASYAGSPTLLGFDEDGRLYKWDTGSPNVTDVGAARVPAHPPTFYRDLSIILDVNGSAAPMKYNGTTLTTLGGSPPNGAVSAVYKDHLVLGYSSATKNRVWFSSAGAPETWDTAADGQWLDCSSPVKGLATIRNMMLVFQEGLTERIRGDIIPGVVGSDMVREPLLQVGCADPASIATSNDFVVFANGAGIYLTDGIGVVDLTKQCGMSEYWKAKLASYSAGTSIAAALWQDWYVFSVSDAGALVTAGMIYVPKRVWVTLTNIHATMMTSTPVGASNIGFSFLWMSEREAPRVSNLGTILSVGGGTDGNGTEVPFSLELPFYLGLPGKKRWKNLYVRYYNVGGSSQSITVSGMTSARHPIAPGTAETYTSLGTLTASSAGRRRFPIGSMTEGLGLKLSQSGGSLVTIYSVEADAWAVEGSRIGSTV